jgi:ATP-dependent helicase/nuclease subunit B
MHVRFVVGPAGSGKTFRCLEEIRKVLNEAPDGPPLVLLAPKQTTYQLERQLLAATALPGYARLHILSFEKLAHFIFAELRQPSPRLLDEEGRLMVLRALVAAKRKELKLFRASARLTGFAQELSLALRELQRNQLSPETLGILAARLSGSGGLALKLQDLSTLLADYVRWLKEQGLQDADCLLSSATEALHNGTQPRARFSIETLWVDGFFECSPQELDLLTALAPFCREVAMTFCLDQLPTEGMSWVSTWFAVRRTFEDCRRRLGALARVDLAIESLPRNLQKSRFADSPILQHLERFWTDPQPCPPFVGDTGVEAKHLLSAKRAASPLQMELSLPVLETTMQTAGGGTLAFELQKSLRVVKCADPDGEATVAAREILQHVRSGGRYRETTVLVRSLEKYHAAVHRVFANFGIPFFLDRRESIAHHPLAELTRSALRAVAFQWQHDDWFAALKTGLLPASDKEIDELENEALSRGWTGVAWHEPIHLNETVTDPARQEKARELEARLETLRRRLIGPFQNLALAIARSSDKPTGLVLAAELRAFWESLEIAAQLESWAEAELSEAEFGIPNSVHATAWEQMNRWVGNIERAFGAEALTLREWLPILEAGLSNLTVGLIPPALDQVFVGAIDRSRNPDIKLALVLGMNETVFPARPSSSVLLSDSDRTQLEQYDIHLAGNSRAHVCRERYYAYIACTRARQRLVLTASQHDSTGAPLNLSPFLSQVERLFPSLETEVDSSSRSWLKADHAFELIGPLLRTFRGHPGGVATGYGDGNGTQPLPLWAKLAHLPAVSSLVQRLGSFQDFDTSQTFTPELAEQLYGGVLHTSVSRLEQFAACPFKFFVHSGLRAQERKRYELDVKEQGTFQHDVLALFHEELRRENKKWRDITPSEARERVARIAHALIVSYREGLLQASAESRFTAKVLTDSLQDFVETLVGWMRQQYQFDPARVELPFGVDPESPAWELELGDGHRLALHGRIDRVDIFAPPNSKEGIGVVVDYKSSHKTLDPVLIAHGLQLQLLAYLNVIRHWPNPRQFFGVDRLVPGGVFYVNLRGHYTRTAHRGEALADIDQARKLAYRHSGRFAVPILAQLDNRPGNTEGDQFNFRLTNKGAVHKSCREPLSPEDFETLLNSIESNLKRMGQAVFSGAAEVAPFRKGQLTACEQCDYLSICRIDPWNHSFRTLKKPEKAP